MVLQDRNFSRGKQKQTKIPCFSGVRGSPFVGLIDQAFVFVSKLSLANYPHIAVSSSGLMHVNSMIVPFTYSLQRKRQDGQPYEYLYFIQEANKSSCITRSNGWPKKEKKNGSRDANDHQPFVIID